VTLDRLTEPMRYLSVCSGIEAASCAWHSLGWTPVAFSEIEPFPSAVLAHHYPDTPNWGDMTKFKEWIDADVDVLVGGTPCQSFSVAGLRKGLADPRGNLMLTYLAIADRYRPTWLVWENVPGVLSSNGGRDFGTFLGGLGELGYGFAYRVLDAQYVRVDTHARAVPQRRRRVFVVGHLGNWRRAATVLFERESLCWHPAPRREAGQGAPANTAPSLTASGRGVEQTGESRGQDPLVAVPHADISPAIKARDSKGVSSDGDGDGDGAILVPMVAPTLRAGGNSTGGDRPYGTDVDACDSLVVAHSLRAEGFDASEDGTGRGTPLVAFDTTQITSKANRSNPQPGDPCHPLAAGAHPPTIAFDCKASGQNGFGVGDIASTMRSMGHSNSHQNGGGHQAVATGMQVRRLLPVECEKLQGFPPGYTAITVKGKPAADGPRYKALGNSMAVNVMRHIGQRIQLVAETSQVEREAA